MRRPSSKSVFESCFSQEAVREVVATRLTEHTARGVDGVGYGTFIANLDQNVETICSKAVPGEYCFSPYRQKLILKGAASFPRIVSIPTIRDRVTLRCLNNFLCLVFGDCKPPHAHPVVTDAIKSFERATPNDSFVKLDVKGFYDNINHRTMERQLRKRIKHEPAISLILRALATPTGATVQEGRKNTLGVPQGLSMSNILASIYMLEIDTKYGSRLDIDYHRYVDDILIRAPSSEIAPVASQIAKALKRTRKLTVHPLGSGKSAIHPFGESVSYLGYKFDGSVVSVREASIKKMMTSLMRILAGMNDANALKSIWRLNLRISGCRIQGSNVGWLFYFSQINDYQILFRLDKQIKARLSALGRSALYSQCKRFIKAHREIKFNHVNTDYVFDFDQFTRAQMLSAIYLIKPGAEGKLDNRTDAEVKAIFFKTMYREAREMERDTLGAFS
ncbi:MAG: hypothetical protein FJX25_06625 [Alphaproteobacteria bacterium]|nr:hypothetical protein [Alphaproteobacteria bacterium]